MILLGKYSDEQNDRNIWEMSLRGIDPKKVPALKEHLQKNAKQKKQESLKPEEAQSYKSMFETALKGIKTSGRKNRR